MSVAVLLLGGCATFAPCKQTPVTATASMRTPPNECRIDGCSMAPDFDFVQCCNNHDVRYWMGGTAPERKAADLEFRECILNSNHRILANIYYYSVRIGGTPYLPTPWRWGFGWDYLHRYDETSHHEDNNQ